MIPRLKSRIMLREKDLFWTRYMPRLGTQPFRMDWAFGMEADYAAITPEEISALARKFLVREKALVVIGTAGP